MAVAVGVAAPGVVPSVAVAVVVRDGTGASHVPGGGDVGEPVFPGSVVGDFVTSPVGSDVGVVVGPDVRSVVG